MFATNFAGVSTLALALAAAAGCTTLPTVADAGAPIAQTNKVLLPAN